MPNALVPAAAEFTTVEPTTKFFDPKESMDLMQRYSLSSRARAFAEGALNSANEIDNAANFEPQDRRNRLERHEWERSIKDRDDEKYQQKKDFETTRAQFLVDMARVDDDDPEFDTKIAGFFADPAAAEDDAVKAIYNLKIQGREDKRRQVEQDRDYQKRLQGQLAEGGYNVQDLLNEQGDVDINRLSGVAQKSNTAKLGREQADAERTRLKSIYGPDPLIDVVQSQEDMDPHIETRLKEFKKAAVTQKIPLAFGDSPEDQARIGELLASAPQMEVDAFVGQLLKLEAPTGITEGMSSEERMTKLLNNTRGNNRPVDSVWKAAQSLWNVANRRGFLASKKPTDSEQGEESPDVTPIIDEAMK